MAARRQAGAERGEADRRGAGAGRRQVADRPGQRGEGRREVGVRARAGRRRARRRAGRPPGGRRRGRSVELRADRPAGPSRSTGTPSAVADAGQHVGEGGRAVGRHRQVRRQQGVTGHGRPGRAGRWRRRGRARPRRGPARGRGRPAGRRPEAASSRSATTETPRHGPGRRPAPSTRASRPAGVEPAAGRGGRGPGAGRGPRGGPAPRGVAAQRPGEDGAGAVGRRDAHLAAGPQGAGDLAEGDRGSSTTSST